MHGKRSRRLGKSKRNALLSYWGRARLSLCKSGSRSSFKTAAPAQQLMQRKTNFTTSIQGKPEPCWVSSSLEISMICTFLTGIALLNPPCSVRTIFPWTSRAFITCFLFLPPVPLWVITQWPSASSSTIPFLPTSTFPTLTKAALDTKICHLLFLAPKSVPQNSPQRSDHVAGLIAKAIAQNQFADVKGNLICLIGRQDRLWSSKQTNTRNSLHL